MRLVRCWQVSFETVVVVDPDVVAVVERLVLSGVVTGGAVVGVLVTEVAGDPDWLVEQAARRQAAIRTTAAAPDALAVGPMRPGTVAGDALRRSRISAIR